MKGQIIYVNSNNNYHLQCQHFMLLLNFLQFLEVGTTATNMLRMSTLMLLRDWVTCPSHPARKWQKLDFEPVSLEPQSLYSFSLHYAMVLYGLRKKHYILELGDQGPALGTCQLWPGASWQEALYKWVNQSNERTGQIWVCDTLGAYSWNSADTIQSGPYGICNTSSDTLEWDTWQQHVTV